MKSFIVTIILAAILPVAASLAASTDTNSMPGGIYKTTVSVKTGQVAIVDASREVVTLCDKSNQVVWATNIVAGLKKDPVLGERKIRGLAVHKGELWVSVGRGYGIVDIKTGDLKGFAQR